jgi:glycosyltransferase involved in cell wall biosynthesis
LKRIVFTVTNDLSYDQRMQRICTSLANAGYSVLLVGRKLNSSIALKEETYEQKRLYCFFKKGFLFYAEYNFRLLFYLLFIKADAVGAIDLDTILPCYFISLLRQKKRIYDAHELFTEMKEVITRARVKKTWVLIEKLTVPEFQFGYTVSYSIAEEFKKRYGIVYEVIRNMPLKKEVPVTSSPKEKNILYQGAVNEARGLENLTDAMEHINAVLIIYGDGNIYEKLKRQVAEKNLQHKILLEGKVVPEKLPSITQQAYIGINLVEPTGLNQLYSLANKFFDYIHAGIPQVTMNFPEYKKINDAYEVAVLLNAVDENEITSALNFLLNNAVVYNKLKHNCYPAREIYNWQEEEKKLISFYKNVFAH